MRKAFMVFGIVVALVGGSLGLARSPQDAAPGAQADGAAPRESLRPLDTDTLAVRILMGVGDPEPLRWDGSLAVDRGEIVRLEGWRFRQGDQVTGATSWKASSLPIRKGAAGKAARKAVAAKKAPARKEEKGGPANSGPPVTPTGVIAHLKAPRDAVLTVAAGGLEARIPLAELDAGAARRFGGGRIEARLVPTHAPIAASDEQEDFPAAVSDGARGAWLAYVAHAPRGPDASEAFTVEPDTFKPLVPSGGGDQIRLAHFDGKSLETALDATPPGRDVWRPAIARDAQGRIHLVWSEMIDGNWDLYARVHDPAAGKWSETRRLTDAPGSDTDAALATAPDGAIWMAWQGWREGQADIWLAPLDDAGQAVNVSDHPANDWSPALAVDGNGTPHVAFDTYRKGDYDVLLYRRTGARGALLSVADSPRFEARPSLAVDRRGRAWVAYEERAANWGKDFGNIPDDPGNALYQSSAVRVRCVEGEQVREAGDPVAQAIEPERERNSFARLALDTDGRPVLLFRHRQEAIWGNNVVMVVGGVWIEYVTALVGQEWSPPRPLPRSDNLLDNRPALVANPGMPMLAFYSCDGRLHREIPHEPDLSRRYYSHSGTPPRVVNNDLFVAALPRFEGPEAAPGDAPGKAEAVSAAHPEEPAALARMRDHRIEAGGKTYQFLRGEFHRHTEISQDGGNDGALEDMWRYALDAGGLDWIGNGDHDNGGGKEYTWWLTQKTTDLYHHAPQFTPMFTYERSVSYPGGHRNVMFPYRGVRTLPRYVDERGVRLDVNGVDEDARMLHRYLNELGGICAVHTSATGMGTDWRASDPKAEPFVEIYQGIRDSYEHLGGPRVARRANEAVGGWKPLGMVWNALAMNYRLGFQASSDHVSTHISYAVAIADQPTRQGIFEAFQKRHCYAATDNILLEVRSGDHLMGDEWTADGPVSLSILAHGTGPIASLDIIKDFRYVFSTRPGKDRVELEWTDDEKRPAGTSWYYVRVVQEDGEIAWGSPMWVTLPGTEN